MVALVSVETVLLVLLVVLVAGLLRSHAEVLRRIGPAGEVPARDPRAAAPRTGAARRRSPPPVAGPTPSGDAVSLAFEGAGSTPTLLAFLTSGCSTCAGFWDTLGERRLPPGVQTLIVTRGAERERPARLRALAPTGVGVVMSSQAWEDYGVPGAPYFVLVDGGVRGEGVATTWQALSSLVTDAIEDQREAEAGRVRNRRAPPASKRRWPRRGSLRAIRASTPAAPDDVSELVVARLRGRGPRRRCRGLVSLRRVDAREHHSARRAGPAIELGGDGERIRARRDAGRRADRRGCWGRSARLIAAATAWDPGLGWPCSASRLAAAVLLELLPGRMPGPRRQVNERWLDEYRGWVYGLGFGAQLGLGVSTVVSSAATYVAIIACAADRRSGPGRAGARSATARSAG